VRLTVSDIPFGDPRREGILRLRRGQLGNEGAIHDPCRSIESARHYQFVRPQSRAWQQDQEMTHLHRSKAASHPEERPRSCAQVSSALSTGDVDATHSASAARRWGLSRLARVSLVGGDRVLQGCARSKICAVMAPGVEVADRVGPVSQPRERGAVVGGLRQTVVRRRCGSSKRAQLIGCRSKNGKALDSLDDRVAYCSGARLGSGELVDHVLHVVLQNVQDL
jgi:hypothetical protein